MEQRGQRAKLLAPFPRRPVWPGEPEVEETAARGNAVPFALIAGICHATGTTFDDVCSALVTAVLARYLLETPAGDVQARPRDVGWLVPASHSSFDPELPPELGTTSRWCWSGFRCAYRPSATGFRCRQ
jgi:diacylglycerol O-acyltransferase